MHRFLPMIMAVLLITSGCSGSKKKVEVSVAPEYSTAKLLVNPPNTLEGLLNDGSRPILVFFYTDWCKYCENMKRTTFRDPRIIEYLNDHFYYVAFNAEQKESLTVAGTKFQYKPRGSSGTHEFAEIMAITDGALNYPTIVIFNKDLEVMFKYNSFLSAEDLLPILTEYY